MAIPLQRFNQKSVLCKMPAFVEIAVIFALFLSVFLGGITTFIPAESAQAMISDVP